MKFTDVAALSIAACLLIGGSAPSFAQTGDGRLAKCKAEIGWASMDKKQKNSPETIRRLDECTKRMK